ncbi:MAG: CHAT domain-containing protein [Vicinamibacterales bacterium]
MLLPATLKDDTLWRAAIAPVLDAIPADALARLAQAPRVFVLPHELLWRVPFEALPVAGEYLGGRAAVTYLSSISARLRPEAVPSRAASPLVAIGSPEIAPALATQLAQTAPDWIIRSAEAASREIAAVSAGREVEAPVRLSGAAATKRAVRDSLAQAGVIHFATPFRVSRGNVLFSSMLLADPTTAATPTPPAAPAAAVTDAAPTAPAADSPGATSYDPADAMLDLRDVINATSNARLVVFSDGGGLSRRDAASDAGTVQWAWRAAGVPAVVLSRWAGDEAADQAFLVELHRQLHDGRAPHEAELNARQLVRGTPGRAAPFYWSGWIGIGP